MGNYLLLLLSILLVSCISCKPTPQKVECDECNGTGYYADICNECDGDKHINCYICDGEQVVPCESCKGIKPYVNNCTNCAKEGYVPCDSCEMNGYLPCPTCKGTGLDKFECDQCGGKGFIIENDYVDPENFL